MIILTVSALYGISLPSGQDPPGFTVPIGCYVIFLGPFFVVAVVIDYFIRLNAINADRARAKQDRGLRSRRRNRRFVVAPLCIVMIISMFATAWPLRARFYFSHVAFERVAQQCIASDKSISRGQWIGLFHIRNVEIVDGEVYFETGSGTWDPVGFVFDTKPPGIRSYFREIVPNWYTYED